MHTSIAEHRREPEGLVNGTPFPQIRVGILPVKKTRRIPWKMIFAVCVMGSMILTAFAVLKLPAQNAPAGDEPARTLQGDQQVTYKINHMFELYKKPTNYRELGRHNSTMGMNSWMALRQTNYGEFTLRNQYPFMMTYNPYSTMTEPIVDVGLLTTSWFRMYLDALNVNGIGTDAGKEAYFVPILGPVSNGDLDGGNVSVSFYSTYLTTTEIGDIRNNRGHYANFYYGVGIRELPALQDDGYWHELQGIYSFDRAAAEKYLNLGAGNLMDQFNASQTLLEDDWMTYLINEGSGGGRFDIYTAYDFPNDVRLLKLKLDLPNSTANSLKIRFYSVSWGNDVMLVRWLEAAGVWKYMEGWADDWYLNVTIGPTEGEIHSRAVIGYLLTAWKDSANFIGGWQIETVHMDWCGNTATHMSYTSPYNPYDPEQFDVRTTSWSPGSTNYGNRVSYFLAPQEWDLLAGETIIIELPAANKPLLGLPPYRGLSDLINAAKLTELRNSMYWGEMIMGNGYPEDLDDNYYNPTTRTITVAGPIDFTPQMNPDAPTILEGGVPTFFFDISPVSSYDVQVTDPMPPELDPEDYYSGYAYNAAVTAKNQTGVTVTTWNGTVAISSTDTNLLVGGAALPASHAFVPGDNGVWITTFTYGTPGAQTVTGTDANLGGDVSGSVTYSINGVIPEFPTLLIPVIGAVAMFVVFGRRAKAKKT